MEEHMIVTVKKTIITIFLFIFIPAVFSYASGNRAAGDTAFNEVQDRYWRLTEVRNGSTVINIDRTNIMRDFYTIKFQAGRLIGAGADNAYFASYTVGEDNALSIGMIGSSRVVPLHEIKNFAEYQYFMCLEKVDRWDIRNGKLELHTYDKDGDEIILVFF
jgi:heat shock protein HslJ